MEQFLFQTNDIMKDRIVDLMFICCFASPILLSVLFGETIYFPMGMSLKMGVGMIILYLPIIGIMSGFSDIKIDGKQMLRYTYGIITFCIGAFLSMVSIWYILVSVFAFIFLFLLYSTKNATR